MKTKKRLLVGLLVLVVLLSLTLTFVACQEEDPPEPPFTAQGEEAVYYRDGANGEETIELRSGSFVMNLAGDSKSGTYVYAKSNKEITLTFSDSSTAMGSLDVSTGVFEILYGGTPYELIKKVNYVVSYNVDGGSAIAPTETLNGKGIARPADPEKEGYIFAGWYTDSAKTVAYNFKTGKITSDTTLYAKFVQKTDGAGEFTVQLINGESVIESRLTNNGLLHNLPELQEEGKTFLGWWISSSRDASKLTRQYTDSEKIEENTNLYAVWAGETPAISVYADKVVWNEVGGGKTTYHYSVKQVGSEISVLSGDYNNQKQEETISVEAKFANYPIGEYEISVTVNGKTSKAYYVNKGLARVSLFEVHGNDLVFNKVSNATEYFISVNCGDPSHKHVEESLGESSTYNFANCQIGAEGYGFTVKATAEGYVESVSDVFVYNRSLGQITGLKRDTGTETLSWTKVEGATSYLVKITVGEETVEKTVYTESIFMGDYRGEIKVEVKSVAFGYQSTTEVIAYTNTRLPAPANIKVSGSTITWDAVEGATGYVVSIDGKEFVTQTNSMTVSDQHFVQGQTEYRISIRANAANAKDNSMYSEEFTAKYGVMGDTVTYSNNVLSWDAVFGAVKYVITINAGTEHEVVMEITDGSISAVITWPKAGENTVSVYSVDKDGNKSSTVSTKVTTYEIKFETGENTVPVEPMYKAIGDEYELPQALANGLTFQGWYDNADYQTAKRYDDKGIMTGDMVVYAGWTKEQFTVTLDVGELGTLDEELRTAKVIYGETYVLPVPVSTDTNKVFAGWYTEPRGAGRRYADQTGASIGGYPQASGRILYASWVDVFKFTVYNNPTTGLYDSIAVSAGPGISYVTEITIPATYTGTLTYMETYQDELGDTQLREVTLTSTWNITEIRSNAFKSCSTLVRINIPSTIEYIFQSLEGVYYGNGAFSTCSRIEKFFVYDVNDLTKEAEVDEDTVYWTKDGVLFENDKTTGEVEVHSWPYNKTGDYTMAYGVTNIPQYALRNAKCTTISLPASVRRLNKYSFYNCSNLTSIIFLEPEVGQVAGGALELTSGDNAAIYSCTNLTTVVFPLRLKSFDAETIKSCSKLSAILIGSDGNEVGDNYASIVYTNDQNQIIGSIITNRTKNTLIYVPRGFKGTDLLDSNGADIGDALRIPNGISIITSFAFGGTSASTASKFTHVYIPGTVTLIEENAFAYCQSMVEVIFEGEYDDPDLTICRFAFKYCNKLTEITLPANISKIEAHAFANTTALTTVNVEANRPYVEFESQAFATESTTVGAMGTFYVTKLNIGPNVPEIDISGVFGNTKLASVIVDPANMFYRSDEEGVLFNRAMTKILLFPIGKGGTYVIPTTVKEIGDGLFNERDALEKVIIHSGLERIGNSAFYGCGALTTVEFLKTEADATPVELIIDESAFYNCTYLTSIEIPARTVRIGVTAFRSCTRLGWLTFEETPAGMTEKPLTIGEYAFAYCGDLSGVKNLTEVSFPERTTEIGNYAFYQSDALETVNIPASVIKMGGYEKQQVYVYGVDAQGNETVSAELKERDVLVSMSVFYQAYGLKNINVDPENKYFMSIDGVLYSKEYMSVSVTNYLQVNSSGVNQFTILDNKYYDNTDGTAKALLVCPAGNSGANGVLTIPNTVMALWYNSFYYNGHATYHSSEVGVTEIKFSKDSIENRAENVLEVHDQVFYYCRKLQSVSLPKGIQSIVKYMFRDCVSLEEITIPNTVETIYKQAFYNCSALHTINFEEAEAGSTPINLLIGGETSTSSSATTTGVFYNCYALKTINLPDRTNNIGAYAFDGSHITAIELPYNLETIQQNAFSDIASLESVSFPNGLKPVEVTSDGMLVGLTISDSAFANCEKLTYVQIPEGVIGIGYRAFAGCVKLKEISLPGSLSYFGDDFTPTSTSTLVGYVFSGAQSLEKITFAANIKIENIYTYSFQDCASLKAIDIPASVKTIGNYAFKGCRSLESITFGQTLAEDANVEILLESVGMGAFQNTAVASFAFPESTASELKLGSKLFKGCSFLKFVYLSSNIVKVDTALKGCYSLEEVAVSEDNPNFKAFTAKDGNKLPILVSKNDESIKFVYADIEGELVIPEGFLYIEAEAFKGQTGITKVVIPNTMLEIGNYAFANCTGMTSVEFGNLPQLYKIGNNAFEYTIVLESFVVPSHQDMNVGNYAFENSGVKTFTFAGSIINLGTSALGYTTNLESIVFPANASLAIGGTALQYSGIKTVEFKGEVKSIGASVFRYCANLTEVKNWPSNITTIPNYAFGGCTSLTEFIIPSTVEELGNYVFTTGNVSAYSNPIGAGIKSITIPKSVKKLGTHLFVNCFDLEKVIFEENTNLTALGNKMMSYCPKLESVDLTPLKNLNFLGTYTFQYSGLKEIVLPESLKTINNNATAKTAGNAYTFRYCDKLEKVIMHDDIQIIGNYVFQGCTSLTTITSADHSKDETPYVGIELPANLTLVGTYLFNNCTSITNVDFSRATGLKKLNNSMFEGCTNLSTVTAVDHSNDEKPFVGVEIPIGITEIGNNVFDECTSIKSVDFTTAPNLTNLGNYVFVLTSLTSVYLPATITTYGTYLFDQCALLEKVEFEANTKLTALGNYMFRDCTSLKEVNIEVLTSLKHLGTYTFRNTAIKSVTLPDSITQFGTSATSCTNSSNVYVFADCTQLESIDLNNVVKIGGYSFLNCTALEEVKGLENVTLLGAHAFRNTGIKSVKFGAAMTGTAYGNGVFAECFNLEKVVIEQGALTYFGFNRTNWYSANTDRWEYGIFAGCTKLSSVTIPSNITKITTDAFYGCTALTNLNFLNACAGSLTEIGNGAFRNMTNVTAVTIPAKVTTIGQKAFMGVNNKAFTVDSANTVFMAGASGELIQKVADGDDIVVAIPCGLTGEFVFSAGTMPGAYCFQGVQISSLVLPEGITEIPSNAFTGATLETVVLPETVTTIGSYAFDGAAIRSINIPASVTTISAYAFRNTTNLVSFTLPETVKNVGALFLMGSGAEEIIIEGGAPRQWLNASGKPMTRTSTCAFAYQTNSLKRLEFRNGSTEEEKWTLLPTYAVYAVNGASFEVVYPDSVTGFETTSTGYSYFFYACKGCDIDFDIPQGITEIPSYLFGASILKSETALMQDRNRVDEVVIPAKVTSIGQYAFSCLDIGYFSWNNAPIKSIGSFAFASSKIPGEVTLPETLETLGAYTFAITEIDRFIFPANWEFIVKGASAAQIDYSGRYSSLTLRSETLAYAKIGELIYSEGITQIGSTNYSYLTDLNHTSIGKIILPSTLRIINPYAFYYIGTQQVYSSSSDGSTQCHGLETYPLEQLVIPEGVEEIHNNAFYGSKGIKNLYLPKSIKYLDGDNSYSYVFSGWEAEQNICFAMSRAEALAVGESAITYSLNKAIVIYDFDYSEIPEVVWPPVVEENPEETPGA